MLYGYTASCHENGDDTKQKIKNYAKKLGGKLDSLVEDNQSNKIHWHKRTALKHLIYELSSEGDEIIVFEAAHLGRSTQQVLEVLELLTHRGVIVHFIKYEEVFTAKNVVDTKQFLRLMQTIESDFVAKRTTEALAKRREKGLPLGRPKGRMNKTLKLDKYRKEIQHYLDMNISKASIAKLINCNAQTLYNYVEKRGLKAGTKRLQPSPLSIVTDNQ